jgi:hypothetical protein
VNISEISDPTASQFMAMVCTISLLPTDRPCGAYITELPVQYYFQVTEGITAFIINKDFKSSTIVRGTLPVKRRSDSIRPGSFCTIL